MKLENQVISLETAQKLKELGVKQEGLFYYRRVADDVNLRTTAYIPGNERWMLGDAYDMKEVFQLEHVSAYTVAELGEMLYKAFEKVGWQLIYVVYGYVFGFKDSQIIGELGIINLMRRPDMGSKMLVYLLENNLLKVADINKD